MANDDVVIRISARNTTKKDFQEARKQLQDFGKTQGFVSGTTKNLTGDLNRGLKRALQQTANQGGFATSALAKMGPVGLAAAASVGVLALGFRSLIRESERLTEESKKLGLSTTEYQKSLGITIPLTADAVEAGNQLSKAWTDLTTSGKNFVLNALEPMVLSLADVTKEFLRASDARDEFDSGVLASGFITAKAGGSLPGMIDPNTAAALARAGINVNVAPGPAIGTGGPQISAELLGRRNAEAKKADEEDRKRREKAEKEWADFLKKINEQTLDQLLGDARDYWANLKQIQQENKDILAMFTPDPQAMSDALDEALVNLGSGIGGVDTLSTRGRFAGMHLTSTAPQVDFSGLEAADEELGEFGLSLEDAASIAQVFGDGLGSFGATLIESSAAADQLSKGMDMMAGEGNKFAAALQIGIGALLGIQALSNATSTGGQGSRAAKGAISGAQIGGSIVPGWGHLIGAGVGALVGWARGAGPAQVGEDAGRNIGVALSQALMEEIHKSGEDAQMFLREIFEEGGLGIDRFAEEVGDLFSFFERGEISEEGLLGELEELLPILIENFDELGLTGKEQIDRIIAAARNMGIELGAAGDALERLAAGIPETTLEGMAEALGISVEKARELAELMGVGMQTDLERLADDLNVPVEALQAAFDALSAQGLADDMGDIQTILDSMGITIEDLLTKLGIELPEATVTAEGALPEPGVFDPEATGASMANHLMPGFRGLEQHLDRLGDKIAMAVRDALAQGA